MLDEDTTFPECTRAIGKACLDKVVPERQRVLQEPDITLCAWAWSNCCQDAIPDCARYPRSTDESHQLPCGCSEERNNSRTVLKYLFCSASIYD